MGFGLSGIVYHIDTQLPLTFLCYLGEHPFYPLLYPLKTIVHEGETHDTILHVWRCSGFDWNALDGKSHFNFITLCQQYVWQIVPEAYHTCAAVHLCVWVVRCSSVRACVRASVRSLVRAEIPRGTSDVVTLAGCVQHRATRVTR